MTQELDSDGFDEEVGDGETWIVDFYADWCGPCQQLEPIYEDVSEEYSDINFGRVDMDENSSIATEVGVKALPTLVVFEEGEEVARRTGATDEDGLREWVESNAA
jgi:thioredoxin|nr:MAG: thioredoxin [Candidatus Nanosalinarum sp. J07AB56]